MQIYYQNEPRFNGVYSRNNLPKIKDGSYVINLDECNSTDVGTSDNTTYFDSFEVEHILKEIEKFIDNRNITTNSFRIQAYDSAMCRYFFIRFIDFMLKYKNVLENSNLFSPNHYGKKDKIILEYFQQIQKRVR